MSGTITVSSGVTSSGVNVSWGQTLVVQSGGVSHSASLDQSSAGYTATSGSAATENVYGASIATAVNDGTQHVFSGGVSSDASVGLSGQQFVDVGAQSVAATIAGGGFVDVGFDALSSSGTQMPAGSAVLASAQIQSGASILVEQGGVMSAATIANSAWVQAQSGATLTNNTISSGGVEFITAGASATNETVQSGGILAAAPGAVVTGTHGQLTGVLTYTASGSTFDVISAIAATDSAISGLDFSHTDANPVMTLVATGQTVDGLTIGTNQTSLTIGGTVSGLTYNGADYGGTTVTIGSGGTLGGTVSTTSNITNKDIFNIVVQSGGTIDLADATHGWASISATIANGGLINAGPDIILNLTSSGNTETLNALSGNTVIQSFTLTDTKEQLKQVGSSGTLYELTDGTPCYCPGTMILTDRGEVAVEDLEIGDQLITKDGTARALRWIGRRGYEGRFIAGRPDMLPVTFAAGSLGNNLPHRDLTVSPLHAMYLCGALVPALGLVNGTTITQAVAVERVDYIHLELESHDVIVAEGALSESFVDDNSRGMFHNAAEYDRLYPAAPRGEALYCAPRVEGGEALDAIRARLPQVVARLVG